MRTWRDSCAHQDPQSNLMQTGGDWCERRYSMFKPAASAISPPRLGRGHRTANLVRHAMRAGARRRATSRTFEVQRQQAREHGVVVQRVGRLRPAVGGEHRGVELAVERARERLRSVVGGHDGNRTRDGGFADLCLTTWLHGPDVRVPIRGRWLGGLVGVRGEENGAEDEARTRDPVLGKDVLYH